MITFILSDCAPGKLLRWAAGRAAPVKGLNAVAPMIGCYPSSHDVEPKPVGFAVHELVIADFVPKTGLFKLRPSDHENLT